jgi:hypothetical protein
MLNTLKVSVYYKAMMSSVSVYYKAMMSSVSVYYKAMMSSVSVHYKVMMSSVSVHYKAMMSPVSVHYKADWATIILIFSSIDYILYRGKIKLGENICYICFLNTSAKGNICNKFSINGFKEVCDSLVI